MTITIQTEDPKGRKQKIFFNGEHVATNYATPHDAMEFFILHQLPRDKSTHETFAKELVITVKETFGSKCSIHVDTTKRKDLQEEMNNFLRQANFSNKGISENILTIAGDTLRTRIDSLKQKLAKEDTLINFDKNYKILWGTEQLKNRADDIYNLLARSGYFLPAKLNKVFIQKKASKNASKTQVELMHICHLIHWINWIRLAPFLLQSQINKVN